MSPYYLFLRKFVPNRFYIHIEQVLDVFGNNLICKLLCPRTKTMLAFTSVLLLVIIQFVLISYKASLD